MRLLSGFSLVGIAVCLAPLSSVALAQEKPSFLEGVALYATDINVCPALANQSADNDALDNALQISQAGIYGNEFGCTFVKFYPERDPESGIIYSWIAIAQCGDDSGITRPDMMTLIFEETSNIVRVQSQNEYTAALAFSMQPTPEQMGENSDPFKALSFVSNDYKRCPNS